MASRIFFRARTTRQRLCRSSSENPAAVSMRASTSAFSAVTYFKLERPLLCNLFGRTGHGIPDIAARALRYVIVYKGSFRSYTRQELCCTGVSYPPPCSFLRHKSSDNWLTANVQTVTGVISLLNDFLIWKGKPPLGFLNPFLYELQGLYGYGIEGLKDII